jgi:hypothetical protein
MNPTMVRSKKLQWLVPVIAAIGAPIALCIAGPARQIAEAAVEHLGDGTILAFAAAANALTVIP